MSAPEETAPEIASLSFEQARDELVRVVAELEQGGEAGDVVRGVDEGQSEVQCLHELEIGVSKLEDVDLGGEGQPMGK